MAHMKNLTQEMRHCIQNCQECATICLETIQHCLTLGGKHARANHIGLLVSCAEICRTSASFMLIGSELHPKVCEVCAEVCTKCAEDCRSTDAKDETMKQCADLCDRCAESCHEMAGAHAMH